MIRFIKTITGYGFVLLIFLSYLGCTQFTNNNNKGKLFIIGGGDRSDALIQKMMEVADLGSEDYVFILPMASSIPDTTTFYIKQQILKQGNYEVRSHKFSHEEARQNEKLIQEVEKAKLIYIPGGDQNRFMKVVRGTQLFEALQKAYQTGSTIAGTSAGAAVMSKIMLTGKQLKNTDGRGFDVLWKDNIETQEGLGFLKKDIIDQHFIKRSRFNRLISVLADFPDKQAIGIDESTAIICFNGQAEVVGDSQVVVLSSFEGLDKNDKDHFGFKNVKFALYKAGDKFKLFTQH